MTTMHGMTAATDENLARRIAVEGDLRFKQAMMLARKRGTEFFTVGVDTTPGTQFALQITPLAPFLSGKLSPAAQCADLGGRAGTRF